MIDMPFQNLSIDNVYLPHKVIEYSSGYYVFERGLYDLNTDIWRGDYFKIDDHAVLQNVQLYQSLATMLK